MPGPPLSREQIAATLRRLRLEFDPGLSVNAAASGVDMHQTTLKRFEDGRHVPSIRHMTRLLDMYRADGFTRAQMLASARERWGPKQQQVVMHDRATTATKRIASAESAAVRVTAFSPMLVPGLVQAPGYLRAVGSTALQGVELDRWFAQRRERQQQMWDSTSTEYVVLTTGAALDLGLGGRDVMTEQIRHLVDVAELGRVRFGIVPVGARLSRYVLHGFDVLDNPDGSRLVHYGTHSGVVTVSEPAEQHELLDVLAEIERAAVFGHEARATLERAADLYR